MIFSVEAKTWLKFLIDINTVFTGVKFKLMKCIIKVKPLVQLCVRDSSGKPTAQRGLAADSPTGRGRARPNYLFRRAGIGGKVEKSGI